MQKFNFKITSWLRKLKVRTRLFVFMIATLLFISTITILVSRYYAQKTADEYIYEYLQDEHRQISNNIELYMEEVIMSSLRYKDTNAFYSLLKDSSLSFNEKEDAMQQAAASIRQPVFADIGNVYLIDKSNQIYCIRNENPTLPAPDINASILTSPYYQIGEIIHGRKNECYLSFCTPFYNFYTSQNLGTLVFYLPQESLSTLYGGQITSSGITFLTDEHGNILSHEDFSLIGTNIDTLGIPLTQKDFSVSKLKANGKDFLHVSTTFSTNSREIGFPWLLHSILPTNELMHVLEQILHAILIAGILIIIVAGMISFFLSNKLTLSLKQLHAKIIDLGRGQMHVFSSHTPHDELWELEQGYNEMVTRIQELLEQNRLEQEKKRELELTALQTQINPHFLYNTLDAIGWLAVLKNETEIEQMVMALSQFFRLTLHKGDKKITIEDEILIVKNYVAIEQLRNPGKFDITYDIQPEITQLLVPKIILQPIVENAIKHGVSQVRRHGIISIRGYRKNDDVFLEVADNGKGYHEKTDQLHPSGYGLKNVNERIQLEYGSRYGLSFHSEPKKGTTVIIYLCFEPST